MLRLGQSLAAMGEKETACAALGEVAQISARAGVNVKRRWAAETCQMLTASPSPVPRRERCSRLLPCFRALIVSGGRSIALLALIARWRAARRRGPRSSLRRSIMACVLPRQRAAGEADRGAAFGDCPPHRGLARSQAGHRAAAGGARGALPATRGGAARRHTILTAHTRDDQAETTVRPAGPRAGLAGLAACGQNSEARGTVRPCAPFSLSPRPAWSPRHASAWPFADDPSNRGPALLPGRARLARGGACPRKGGPDARRAWPSRDARRRRRADEAEEAVVDADQEVACSTWTAWAAGPRGVALRICCAACEIARGAASEVPSSCGTLGLLPSDGEGAQAPTPVPPPLARAPW